MSDLPLDLGSSMVMSRLRRFPRGATLKRIASGSRLTERQTKRYLHALCKEGYAKRLSSGEYTFTTAATRRTD